MYTLHVVASERRLSQLTLPTSGRGDTASGGAIPDDASSYSDDSDGELLGLDLDDDSQAIEFTAGNPRVEHITGVVHLYRPTPGRLPQTVQPTAAVSASSAAPNSHGVAGAGTLLPSYLQNPATPSKGTCTWASLFSLPSAAAPPPAAQACADGSPWVGEQCDELCCLALPCDMTIADFCTFLGAHLLRLRRMRVLRRQVGATTSAVQHAAAALAASTAATTTSSGGNAARAAAAAATAATGGQAAATALATASPDVVAAGATAAAGGTATAAVASPQGDGNGCPAVGIQKQQQQQQQQQQGQPGEQQDQRQRRESTPAQAGGPPSEAAVGGPPTRGLDVAGPAADAESGGAHTERDNDREPKHGLVRASAAGVPAPAAPPPSRAGTHHEARPPSQRVVCMVVMRMESPEAAEELYADLNGKPFSSLEPDIVCRLVHVRHVEVTSGGGRHADAPAAADAAAGGPQPPPGPPPGQTELPTCPVCLERLDEHVSGIVTTVCNHVFHSECLQKWSDTTCPVCRYCVQGAANTSRCGVCGTAVDLWICLICGHVGCGRYRAGHAADHWRTSGHCYALELETQRVWDYVGDNYVHRLIQSKTDGKLVELAAPATAITSPNAAGRGGGGQWLPHHHHHQHSAGTSCCASAAAGASGGIGDGGGGDGSRRAGGGGGGGYGYGYEYGRDNGAGSSGGGPGWSSGDDELKEALMSSKLDAIAVEYNHLLASQLDSQRQYYEGLVAQATLDADHRCAQAGAAADKARLEAEEAQTTAREEARRRLAAERKAAETAETLRTVRQEAEFLRSLNETLLANQRDFKQQLAAERSRAEAAEAAVKELQEQVRDLAFFIEAQRAINDAGGGELKDGTVLPLPQGAGQRGGRGGSAASGSKSGARGGGGSGRSAAK